MATRVVIPFGRAIHRGSRGKDVLAVKRALARTGYGKLGALGGGLAGPFFVRNLKAFQKRRRVGVSGVYDVATHRALAASFDSYATFLYLGHLPPKPRRETAAEKAARVSQARRKRIVAAFLVLYNHRAEVHYTQGSRRMDGLILRLRLPKFPRYGDCSSISDWTYFAADAPDPNGTGYNPAATCYTGTLSKRGRKVTLAQAQPGDLVFYGSGWPWGHVAVYIGGKRVLSHGSEAGPYLLPVDYRSDRGEIRSYL